MNYDPMYDDTLPKPQFERMTERILNEMAVAGFLTTTEGYHVTRTSETHWYVTHPVWGVQTIEQRPDGFYNVVINGEQQNPVPSLPHVIDMVF